MEHPLDIITTILYKHKLTKEDRIEIAELVKGLNESDFNDVFEYAQSALAHRFETNQDTDVISDIIADLQNLSPLDNQPPPKIATIYRKINEENGNNEDDRLPIGVPGNSAAGPNERFVPKTRRQWGYEQLSSKPMKGRKGTPRQGNLRRPLPRSYKGGKRKKSRKTRRKHRKY
jgi:hypothetical protein